MRRLLGLLVVAVMLIPAGAAFADDYYEYYKDRFKDGNYSGNEGTLWFEGPWYEQDPGGGGYTSGNIHVGGEECADNDCLHIESVFDLLRGVEGLAEPVYIKRYADLTMFETVELCFEMEVHNNLEAGAALLSVQVSTDGGSKWSTLPDGTRLLLTAEEYEHPRFDLTPYISEKFAFRYLITGVTGLETFDVAIDSVEIKGTVEPPPTTSTSSTTSTTKPTTTTSTAPATTTTTQAATSTSTSQPTTTTTSVPASTTSTTVAESGLTGLPPFDGGIRALGGGGLIADYTEGMMGDMEMGEIEVLGAEFQADFSMAVEVFESSKVWIAVLALMITAAVVSGMDSRRTKKQLI